MYKLSAVLFFAMLGSSISLHLIPTYINKWDNGIVPLEIKGDYSPADLKVLNEAIDSLHKETCVKFVPRTSEKNYVTIQNTASGCWALVGQLGGQQMVNFQTPQCTEKVGTVQHELIHVLGFVHAEHDEDGFYDKHGQDQVNKHGDDHEHEHEHEHEHDHKDEHKEEHNHDHHHDHDHEDGLSKDDVDNINKMYSCDKPTGVQSPFTLTV